MTGQSCLFLTTLALGLVGVAWGAQPVWGAAAAACRLDDEESESWGALLSAERLDAWICSLAGSLMVGLSGVFPLLVIPLETGAALRSEAGSQRLKQLLSFALGGLLGNVFLHLLPEAWAYTCSATTGRGGQSLQQQQLLGLWVITGFLTFLGLEKMFLDSREKDHPSQAPIKDPAAAVCNGGRCLALPAAVAGLSVEVQKIKISGYLNLLANTIDNFTHGLAVAASFLVSKKIGLLTTMAILLHEIPHEVGDFAILLRAGFDRWSAAKLQLWTALGGILGACFAICAQSPKGAGRKPRHVGPEQELLVKSMFAPSRPRGTHLLNLAPPQAQLFLKPVASRAAQGSLFTRGFFHSAGETVAWILPFTSGGFLYIALVNVLPDLLEEEDPWNSLQQVLLLFTGIVMMVLFSLLAE